MFEDLLAESRAIQQMLYSQRRKPPESSQLARSFTNLMFQGKTTATICLLTNSDRSQVCNWMTPSLLGPLTLQQYLCTKGQTSSLSTLYQGLACVTSARPSHSIIYKRIDGHCIKTAALHTFCAGGSLGTDAHCWRRLCTAFKSSSNDLCHPLFLLLRNSAQYL